MLVAKYPTKKLLNKGFFLDKKDGWDIIQDERGDFLLVRAKDSEDVEFENE